MRLLEENPPMGPIYDILRRLGITANYVGFFYASYGVWLCTKQPERLLLVTKWLYPDIAAHYGTNWKTVERDLRTVVAAAWRNNPTLLETLAGRPLHEKPCSAQFFSILAAGIFPKGVA